MLDLEDLYFEWLLTCLDPEGVTEEVAYVCGLLHRSYFKRRVGNDINRAVDGADLRKEFMQQFEDSNFDLRDIQDLMMMECTWFEMLVALSIHLDFLYEGGVEGRFTELITNLGLDSLLTASHRHSREEDQQYVDRVTDDVDNNHFDQHGHGGLFPLKTPGHPDQRGVEIWDQHAAYFRERLEGVLWTSTK